MGYIQINVCMFVCMYVHHMQNRIEDTVLDFRLSKICSLDRPGGKDLVGVVKEM